MQDIKNNYKETDLEKDEGTRIRKRNWQRAKTLRLKTEKTEKMEQEKRELGNQVIVKSEDEKNARFCVDFYKLQKLHEDNNLVVFSNWMSNIQSVNIIFLALYEIYRNK